MAEGVAVVEVGAFALLRFVFGDNGTFDFAGTDDGIFECIEILVEDAFGVFFHVMEEFGIGDDAVFDDFGESGAQFAVGQAFEEGEIDEHGAGLMERADDVLPERMIHTGLTADAGVDLGDDSRWDLNVADAAHEGCRGESGDIADDAAAERDNDARAVESSFEKGFGEFLDAREAFVGFAGAHGAYDRLELCGAHEFRDAIRVDRRDVGIGDDGDRTRGAQIVQRLGEFFDHAVADVNGIRSIAERNFDGFQCFTFTARPVCADFSAARMTSSDFLPSVPSQ